MQQLVNLNSVLEIIQKKQKKLAPNSEAHGALEEIVKELSNLACVEFDDGAGHGIAACVVRPKNGKPQYNIWG